MVNLLIAVLVAVAVATISYRIIVRVWLAWEIAKEDDEHPN